WHGRVLGQSRADLQQPVRLRLQRLLGREYPAYGRAGRVGSVHLPAHGRWAALHEEDDRDEIKRRQRGKGRQGRHGITVAAFAVFAARFCSSTATSASF